MLADGTGATDIATTKPTAPALIRAVVGSEWP
jgi:hypothetical protein